MEPVQSDPYDREKVLDKLAEHAWNHTTPEGDLKHRQEFIDKGINSEAELRKAIADGIERSDTPAFSTRPDPLKNQKESREFYEVSMKDKQGEPYKMLVVLNPGLNKHGDLSGGTCYIPADDQKFKKEYDTERDRRHNREIGWEPQLVMGGRPAIREQEQQRKPESLPQNRSPAADPKHARENAAPANTEKQEQAKTSTRTVEPSSTRPSPFDPKYAREPLGPSKTAAPEPAPQQQPTAKPGPERSESQPQVPPREQAAPERKQESSVRPSASEQTMKSSGPPEQKGEPKPVQQSRPPSFDPKYAKEAIGPSRNATVEPPRPKPNRSQTEDTTKQKPMPEPGRQQQQTAKTSPEPDRKPFQSQTSQPRKEPEPSSRGPKQDNVPHIERDRFPKGPRR